MNNQVQNRPPVQRSDLFQSLSEELERKTKQLAAVRQNRRDIESLEREINISALELDVRLSRLAAGLPDVERAQNVFEEFY